MANEASLIGHTVLVVEDDFHLASCTHHALTNAGAEVLGPAGQEDEALALIYSRTPSCAIIDINLGEGARFTVADALKAKGVPFMFMTGYDDVMIPERFNDVGRMRKPSGFGIVVQAAAQMCRERRNCQFLQAETPELMSMSFVRKTTSNALAGHGVANTGTSLLAGWLSMACNASERDWRMMAKRADDITKSTSVHSFPGPNSAGRIRSQ